MHKEDIPAFPVPGLQADASFNGMPLRHYFAARAMHQFLHGSRLFKGFDASSDFAELAARAYEVADAMIKEGSA